ncbi:MAG: antitoxin VapB family protein [Thermoplasmata archaeon]
MSVKTVTLSSDAYDSLARLKRDGESFSEVVRRITGSQVLLTSFAGAWSGAPKAQLEEIRKSIQAADRQSKAKVLRLSLEGTNGG